MPTNRQTPPLLHQQQYQLIGIKLRTRIEQIILLLLISVDCVGEEVEHRADEVFGEEGLEGVVLCLCYLGGLDLLEVLEERPY